MNKRRRLASFSIASLFALCSSRSVRLSPHRASLRMPSLALVLPALLASLALAAKTPKAASVDAAVRTGKANTFAVVGDTGVSAQQMFLGVRARRVCALLTLPGADQGVHRRQDREQPGDGRGPPCGTFDARLIWLTRAVGDRVRHDDQHLPHARHHDQRLLYVVTVDPTRADSTRRGREPDGQRVVAERRCVGSARGDGADISQVATRRSGRWASRSRRGQARTTTCRAGGRRGS